MNRAPTKSATHRLFAVALALSLVFPLGRMVLCVDEGGQAEIAVAHCAGEHHHELVDHDESASHHAMAVAVALDHAAHVAAGAHECHDQVVSADSAPNVRAQVQLSPPTVLVRVAADWPIAALHTGVVQAACALRGCGPPRHHVITSVVALI